MSQDANTNLHTCLINTLPQPPPLAIFLRSKGVSLMGARDKLNQGYIRSSLIAAAVLGAICQSWTVFWVTAAILIGLSVHSGGIRPSGSRGQQRRPRGRGPRNNRRFRE